jgi:hypothetical protein
LVTLAIGISFVVICLKLIQYAWEHQDWGLAVFFVVFVASVAYLLKEEVEGQG